jgi:hypothetical protein
MTDPTQSPSDASKVHNQASIVLCVVRDLLFYSKIRAAAAAVGVELRTVRDPARLSTETVGGSFAGAIVDLNQPGALQAAADWYAQTSRPVVGFVSHVDTETITRARSLGIDRIFARSQFEQKLPALLSAMQTRD